MKVNMVYRQIAAWGVPAALAVVMAAPQVAIGADGTVQATVAASSAAPANALRIKLADAVPLALGQAPALKAAEAQRNAQTEARRGAWSDVGPRVTAAYSQVRFNDAVKVPFGPNIITVRPAKSETASIMVAQPITGAVALIVKAKYEGLQEDLKEQSLQLTRADVAFRATDTWLTAYQAQRQLEIAEASVAAAESQARDGNAMERAGRVNRGDNLKLQLAVSEAKGNVALARAGRDTAFAALREALNMPMTEEVALDGELPAVPPPPETKQAVDEALGNRLETKQAKTGISVAHMYKDLAYATFTPQVSIFAKSEKNLAEVSFGSEKFTHTYGVQASWDLWTNGTSVFQLRQASQGVIAAEEGVRGSDQQVRLDILQAIANYKASQESLAVAKVGVNQAEEAYRIEQARFKTGSRSATDLVLAETSRTAAKGRLVTAQTNLVRWHLKTQKALGAELPKL